MLDEGEERSAEAGMKGTQELSSATQATPTESVSFKCTSGGTSDCDALSVLSEKLKPSEEKQNKQEQAKTQYMAGP